MIPATMNSSSTFPAAFASAHTASTASGSSTSCTQRGMTVRGGSSCSAPEESGSSCSLGGAASRVLSEKPLICLPASAKYG